VFFGDAPADREAASRAGVAFVAVNPNPQLLPLVSRWVPDFEDVDRVLDLARNAG
jgi:phosphoglycolate phosphatase-like HAD superfamily hydrolase